MNASIQNTANPLVGPRYLLRGLNMLAQPGVRNFVWAPLLINLALYSFGAWAGVHYFSQVLNWLMPTWLEWLRWLLWPLFALLLSVIAFFSFTLVANVIASPFYGRLAEKVLQSAGIALPTKNGEGIVPEVLADVVSELHRIAYFALRALPILIVSAIPGLNVVAPFLWLLFGAWSLSLEYWAYPLEAQGIRFDRQRELAASRRLEALSFGGTAMFCLSVPVLNILIPPAAVVGATLYCAEKRLASAPK
jgi:CysZ protein